MKKSHQALQAGNSDVCRFCPCRIYGPSPALMGHSASVSFYPDHHYWLCLILVEWLRLIFHLCESDIAEVYASDGAVVHSAVVYPPAGYVCRHGPLCRTRNVWHLLSLRELYACGYVEVVQDMECLHHRFLSRSLSWRCDLEESRPHES